MKQCSLLIKNSKRILIYRDKFLLSLFLSHNLKSTIVLHKNEIFRKTEVLKRILIYQQKIKLSLFLSHNPKSTIVLYRKKNFPKIAAFVKIIWKNATYWWKILKEYSSINKDSCYPNLKVIIEIYNSSP